MFSCKKENPAPATPPVTTAPTLTKMEQDALGKWFFKRREWRMGTPDTLFSVDNNTDRDKCLMDFTSNVFSSTNLTMKYYCIQGLSCTPVTGSTWAIYKDTSMYITNAEYKIKYLTKDSMVLDQWGASGSASFYRYILVR